MMRTGALGCLPVPLVVDNLPGFWWAAGGGETLDREGSFFSMRRCATVEGTRGLGRTPLCSFGGSRGTLLSASEGYFYYGVQMAVDRCTLRHNLRHTGTRRLFPVQPAPPHVRVTSIRILAFCVLLYKYRGTEVPTWKVPRSISHTRNPMIDSLFLHGKFCKLDIAVPGVGRL